MHLMQIIDMRVCDQKAFNSNSEKEIKTCCESNLSKSLVHVLPNQLLPLPNSVFTVYYCFVVH